MISSASARPSAGADWQAGWSMGGANRVIGRDCRVGLVASWPVLFVCQDIRGKRNGSCVRILHVASRQAHTRGSSVRRTKAGNMEPRYARTKNMCRINYRTGKMLALGKIGLNR